MKARRILILLLAWLSFDLATPLPGAFEFEADDSEIEESIHVRREARGRRAAGTERVTPQARAEQQPTPTRRVTSPLPEARRSLGDEWLPYVRLAHLPGSGRAQTSEAH
jgi:hypothetical protein